MRQFPPETNRYITSAREREKKEKKLFSLFLEKHKFFFWSDVLHAWLHWEHSSGAYVWTSRLNYSSGGVPWLKEGSSRGCRSFLAAVRTRSGASFSWFFDVIFLAPLPPPSLPPPPASLFRISRRQELWRDKCILAEPKEKNRGGKAYRWWRWRGEPWLEGWREESRRTASRWPRRCSGRWWSSEHLDGESTRREKPQQDVQMCMTVWMTEQKLS